jgi:diaminohydroxyphosphoribosylaminopyrimidine deaminase/5-amino-6-(5-phosphoribosylamino)uracil reductase
MVGVGTILRDDPLLNVRLPGVKTVRHPLRVIVDSRLRIPLSSRVVKTAGEYPTLAATTPAASPSTIKRLETAGLTVISVKGDAYGGVDLRALMRELGRRGILSVLLEGGPTLNTSAMREKIVDRMVLFMAPKIIGGGNCPGVFGGEGCLRARDAQPWKILRVKRIGPDLMIVASPSRKQRAKSLELNSFISLLSALSLALL